MLMSVLMSVLIFEIGELNSFIALLDVGILKKRRPGVEQGYKTRLETGAVVKLRVVRHILNRKYGRFSGIPLTATRHPVLPSGLIL